MADKKVDFSDGLSQEAEKVKIWASANVWIALAAAFGVGLVIGWMF